MSVKLSSVRRKLYAERSILELGLVGEVLEAILRSLEFLGIEIEIEPKALTLNVEYRNDSFTLLEGFLGPADPCLDLLVGEKNILDEMISVLEVLVALNTLGDIGPAVTDINDVSLSVLSNDDSRHTVLGIRLGGAELRKESLCVLVLFGGSFCNILSRFFFLDSAHICLGSAECLEFSCGSRLSLFFGKSCLFGYAGSLLCESLCVNGSLSRLFLVGSLGVKARALAVVIGILKRKQSFLCRSLARLFLGSSSASLKLLVSLDSYDKSNSDALFIVRELLAVVEQARNGNEFFILGVVNTVIVFLAEIVILVEIGIGLSDMLF